MVMLNKLDTFSGCLIIKNIGFFCEVRARRVGLDCLSMCYVENYKIIIARLQIPYKLTKTILCRIHYNITNILLLTLLQDLEYVN